MSTDTLTRKRVAILHRHFSYVCDDTHAFGPDDLIALRQRFAINAHVQKVPDAHKWLLKITSAFENMTAIRTPGERQQLYHTTNAIYHDNRSSFAAVRPEDCRLGLQRI